MDADEKMDMDSNNNSKTKGKRKNPISLGGKIGGLVVVVVVGFLTAMILAKRNKRRDFNGNTSSQHGKSPKACKEVNKNKVERETQGLRCLLRDYHPSNGDRRGFSTTEIETTVPEKEIIPLQVAEYTNLADGLISETENESSKDEAWCSHTSTMAESEAYRQEKQTTFETMHNRCSSYSAFSQTAEKAEHKTLKIWGCVFSILVLSLISVSGKSMFVALIFTMMFKAVCNKINQLGAIE